MSCLLKWIRDTECSQKHFEYLVQVKFPLQRVGSSRTRLSMSWQFRQIKDEANEPKLKLIKLSIFTFRILIIYDFIAFSRPASHPIEQKKYFISFASFALRSNSKPKSVRRYKSFSNTNDRKQIIDMRNKFVMCSLRSLRSFPRTSQAQRVVKNVRKA